jgi:hypothetical protein
MPTTEARFYRARDCAAMALDARFCRGLHRDGARNALLPCKLLPRACTAIARGPVARRHLDEHDGDGDEEGEDGGEGELVANVLEAVLPEGAIVLLHYP